MTCSYSPDVLVPTVCDVGDDAAEAPVAVSARGIQQIANADQIERGCVKRKIQVTVGPPRCRNFRSKPIVFIQPKISSTRLRLRWLTA